MVNLIANREIVKELIAEKMNVANIKGELQGLLNDEKTRDEMLKGYAEVREKLGEAGAPKNAANIMIELLESR